MSMEDENSVPLTDQNRIVERWKIHCRQIYKVLMGNSIQYCSLPRENQTVEDGVTA